MNSTPDFPPELLTRKGLHTLSGIAHGAEGLVIARLAHAASQYLVFVATNDREMDAVRNVVQFFAPSTQIIALPAWDTLPYDRISPNTSLLAERMVALSLLAKPASAPRIILTTINAALQLLPPRAVMARSEFTLTKGATLFHDDVLHFLIEHGYRRTATAIEAGEFAVRGSIIDIILPGSNEGIRCDFFGSTLDSLRQFDPMSQRSLEDRAAATLLPASEVVLNATTIACFRENYRAVFGAAAHSDPLYESVSEGRSYPGMEHLLPLFYPELQSLFSYLPNGCILFAEQALIARKERMELTQEFYGARLAHSKTKSYSETPYHALPPERLFITDAGWEEEAARHCCLVLSPFVANEQALKLHYLPGKNYALAKHDTQSLFDVLKQAVADHRTAGRSTIIACYSQGSRERLATMLHEHQLFPLRIDSADGIADISGKTIGLAILPMERGIQSDSLVILTEQDLFGERIIRTTSRKKKSINFLSEAAQFMPGELVVHREHGIGRFEGLITLDVSGALHDCLKVIYDGDDKLFLPVENIELLSRFGSEEEGSKLDKLGSASWQSRKAKLKERITIAAEELMNTAALRATSEATPFTPPHGLYEEFCARFPYAETEDQARAIEDILSDISSGRPTDRLVCGDVGFGKTEVALRAAFVAACAQTEHGAAQVALVCPTTLLCRQHFYTFSKRFEGLPFTIRQMSRLTTAKQNKDTLEGLANGRVNIVIGTHALLAKTVAFKNLSMLIIDEEQHFGVAQKERLKSLRGNIHVLTLSATPIPRTLQLALSGVRELSIIATPPLDRLAVRTFVMPVDPVVIREAILREHHRSGKIFYVTPRIEYMAELQRMLAELVPEIKVVTAHGQMPPAELDRIMNAFYDGKYDLLLSTSIVESGLDIPTVNTIFVDRAHMFGLSQLYQLRGRVGRGKTRAYAYYTLPHYKNLSRAATRRLEVMQTLDNLGAGFTLASHDMDIRGFGNLLGQEQSGHVREVGIELYQQMLEEAIAAAKTKNGSTETEKQSTDEWSPQINLGMTVLIPESYVQDLELRLGLYRRVATLRTEEELHSFATELVDRFGILPQEVEHLLAVVRLKQLCREAGVERMDTGAKGAVLTFRNNQFVNPDKLLGYIARHTSRAKLRPDHKLVLLRDWSENTAQKLKDVRDSISEIAKLAA